MQEAGLGIFLPLSVNNFFDGSKFLDNFALSWVFSLDPAAQWVSEDPFKA